MPPDVRNDKNGPVRVGAASRLSNANEEARHPETDLASSQRETAESSENLLRQILKMVADVRDLLTAQRTIRDYYSTEQVAKILGKANWTVREWCRLGRIHAEKRRSGRGRAQEWVISHAELQRIEKEGLLPVPKYRA
jgi:Helix-turn-helix domain